MTISKRSYRSEISRLINELSVINQKNRISGDRAGMYRRLNGELGIPSITFANSEQLQLAVTILQNKINPKLTAQPRPQVVREDSREIREMLADLLISIYGITNCIRRIAPQQTLELDYILRNMTNMEQRLGKA